MFKNIIGFGLVAVMLLACFAGIASAEVSYAKTYTDPSGDVKPEQNDDADILEMKSTPSGDNVLVTIKVKGTPSSNATYSMTLNIDGEEGSIASVYGMTVFTVGETTDFIDLTFSGNTATFTVPKSDIGATTTFDICEAYIVDWDYNMDTATGGAAPADDDTDDDTTPVDDDTTPIDDDISYPDEYDDTKDPKTETPTDTTISVDIGDFTFDYKETTTTQEMTMKLKGKTSGKVDHCAMTYVTYYDDGTHDEVYWTVGDFDYGSDSYFKGTGTGGKTDWSTWEFYMHYKGPIYNDTSDDDDKNDTKKIKSIVFYVRAFSDADQKKWNQDSKDCTGAIKAKSPNYADSDFVDEPSKKKSPGFEFIFVMAAAAVVGVVFWIRRKY